MTVQTYPKVKSVTPCDQYNLRIVFDNNVEKVYDCEPLLSDPIFQPLQEKWLFKTVKTDAGGYGISWNDEIDLSEAELWENGIDCV